MIIATTPLHEFTLPCDPTDCEEILVTYQQDGKTVLEKSKVDGTCDSQAKTFSIRLTQEDTKNFVPGEAFVQVTAVQSGIVMKQDPPSIFHVYKPFNDEVL